MSTLGMSREADEEHQVLMITVETNAILLNTLT